MLLLPNIMEAALLLYKILSVLQCFALTFETPDNLMKQLFVS